MRRRLILQSSAALAAVGVSSPAFAKMKRQVFYSKGWFRADKVAIQPWTEDAARAAHEAKKLYTALIDSIERPFCFLEITKGFVGVSFLDRNLRVSLDYGFREVSPGKIFLGQATHREFDGDTDVVLSGTSYFFKPDGSVTVQQENFRRRDLKEGKSTVDVSKNYSTWPEFGEYDDLIRIER